MALIKLTKNERKKIAVIFTCLVIAVVGWLLLALNSKYIYSAKTVMVYKNFPRNRAFHPLQSDTLDLKVEGTGWQLLLARLRVNPLFVDINLSKLNASEFIVFSDQITAINRQLNSSQRVIAANPDTLYFDFSRSFERRIPVKLVSDLKFKPQFGLAKDIELKPAYVNVRGPIELIKDLKYWETDTLKLSDLNARTTLTIPLKRNELKNVNVFPNNVEVTAPVEEFTEKTIDLPVSIRNNNTYLDVAIFPKKVKVTILVSFSAFPNVDTDYLQATVDLSDWKLHGSNKLPVSVTRLPKFSKVVKITPSVVDFLIEK